jgi:hypothetical protein
MSANKNIKFLQAYKMKKIITLTFLVMFSGFSYAQQASEYFPEQTGFVWNYRSTPLDSLNNNIDSLAFARIDSFAVVSMHQGKNANIVPTKSGPYLTINLQNFDDTLFYHFDGTDGYDFFDLGPLELVLAELDSIINDTTFSFVDFFRSFEDWYSVYRFASSVNDPYTLMTKDTIINAPVIGPRTFRFEYLGTRLPDENLQTAIGNLDCKKFLIEWKVSVFLFPPLPPTTLLTTENTIWIAPDYWIVQDIIPTNHINLSIINPAWKFSIAGLKTEVESVTNIEEEFSTPENFYLSQNYPNPFNPATKIKFQISSASGGEFVKLNVYDVLGNEVATLINEKKSAGTYEVFWNAENIPSGVYLYKLTAGNLIETKKMLLLK